MTELMKQNIVLAQGRTQGGFLVARNPPPQFFFYKKIKKILF